VPNARVVLELAIDLEMGAAYSHTESSSEIVQCHPWAGVSGVIHCGLSVCDCFSLVLLLADVPNQVAARRLFGIFDAPVREEARKGYAEEKSVVVKGSGGMVQKHSS